MPEPALQFGAGHDFAGILQQRFQDFEWLVFQLDADAALAQFPGLRIDFENPETNTLHPRHRFRLQAYHQGVLDVKDLFENPSRFLSLAARHFVRRKATCPAL